MPIITIVILVKSSQVKSSQIDSYQANTILDLRPFEVIWTSHKKEHIFICICVSVSMRVCEEDVHEKRQKG